MGRSERSERASLPPNTSSTPQPGLHHLYARLKEVGHHGCGNGPGWARSAVRRRVAERWCTVVWESPPPVVRFLLVSPACARRQAVTALRESHPLPQPRRWPHQAVPGGFLARGTQALFTRAEPSFCPSRGGSGSRPRVAPGGGGVSHRPVEPVCDRVDGATSGL